MPNICQKINSNCNNDPNCPALVGGSNCWLVKDAACCMRNDKSRCCFCNVYLAYLDCAQGEPLRQVEPESHEDERFSESSREYYQEHGHSICDAEIVVVEGGIIDPDDPDTIYGLATDAAQDPPAIHSIDEEDAEILATIINLDDE